jgi:cobalamin biosynthesis protein CobW
MAEPTKSFSKIPATIVTGFLGAGKTTLLRHVISHAKGRRVAVIVNEFGDAGFDGDLISDCGDADCRPAKVVELTNGCICCTVADDFQPALEAILALDPRPDHILIETSGLALPKPLVKAFDWPAIRSKVTVDGVIAVVDGPATASGQFAEDTAALDAMAAADNAIDHDFPLAEVFEDQIAVADLIIINKRDLMSDDDMAVARGIIAGEMKRKHAVVEAAHGVIAPDVMLGLHAAAEDDLPNRPTHHDEGEHDHDDFDTHVLSLPSFASLEDAKTTISTLVAAHEVLRAKGYAEIAGKPMRAVIQAVGNRVQAYFDKPWEKERKGQLVVIGLKGLDPLAIAATLSEQAKAA